MTTTHTRFTGLRKRAMGTYAVPRWTKEPSWLSWMQYPSGCGCHSSLNLAVQRFTIRIRIHSQDAASYASLLRSYDDIQGLPQRKVIHTRIIIHGLHQEVIIGNLLIEMYWKLGALQDARLVFDTMCPETRNIFSWTAMIAGCVNTGHEREALQLFYGMQLEGQKPDKVVFVIILKACSALTASGKGKSIHCGIIGTEFETDNDVACALTTMYSKCGSMQDIWNVFNSISRRSSIIWNIIISTFCLQGQGKKAFQLFQLMQQEGVSQNEITYTSIFNAFLCPTSLAGGTLFHAHVIHAKIVPGVILANAIIHMYCKCGYIEQARSIFHKMEEQDVVSWTTMITAFVQHDCSKEALKLFKQMQMTSVIPNEKTLVAVLSACAILTSVVLGKLIHAYIILNGIESDVVVGNALLNMYSKGGSLWESQNMIVRMQRRDAISWNTIIQACAQQKHDNDALLLFSHMLYEGTKPNISIIIAILRACSSLRALGTGKFVHSIILKQGLGSENVVASAMLNMYSTCGSLEHLLSTFDVIPQQTVFLWNNVIAAYGKHGAKREFFQLFQQLHQQIEPSDVSFIVILDACAFLEDLPTGKFIHGHLLATGFESHVIIENALLNMYAKCSGLHDACEIFNQMLHEHVVAWTTMIGSYAESGHVREACRMFQQMKQTHIRPNNVTFINILKVCSCPAHLSRARAIHACIIKHNFDLDSCLVTALLTGYANCGSADDAHQVFETLDFLTISSWNAMIGACAQCGYYKCAFKLFQVLQVGKVIPNIITYVSTINACYSPEDLAQGKWVHAGIICNEIQSDMIVKNALINMYGKCCSLDEADKVFEMAIEDGTVSWNSIIIAYNQEGYEKYVFMLFWSMHVQDIRANEITFASVLNACNSQENLARGKLIHACLDIIESVTNVIVGNALLNMYGKHADLYDTRRVFEGMHQHDTISWNTMLMACCQTGHSSHGLELFATMQMEGTEPDESTFSTILGACANLAALEYGQLVAECIKNSGLISDIAVDNGLINMYGKCGCLENAKEVFDAMLQRDNVSWSAMVTSYAQHGKADMVIQLVQNMHQEGISPTAVTVVSILASCSHAGFVNEGCHYFTSMSELHGITVIAEHYNCMIYVLGRAGRWDEAEEFCDVC